MFRQVATDTKFLELISEKNTKSNAGRMAWFHVLHPKFIGIYIKFGYKNPSILTLSDSVDVATQAE